MSVTFIAAAWQEHPKFGRVLSSLRSCDCSRRWCDACDAAWAKDESAPDQFSCEVCDHELNVSNANARDLLAWLGLVADSELCGDIDARELAAKCRRRLWEESRNHDAAVAGFEDKREGRATMIDCGRSADYLRERTAQLLSVAEFAGDNLVGWA